MELSDCIGLIIRHGVESKVVDILTSSCQKGFAGIHGNGMYSCRLVGHLSGVGRPHQGDLTLSTILYVDLKELGEKERFIEIINQELYNYITYFG